MEDETQNSLVETNNKTNLAVLTANMHNKGKNRFPHARVTHFFPKKPFNYTLIDLTICFIFSYECIVCASNPSLVTGCLVLKLVDHFLAKLTDFLLTS